jgi:hypothetical protein
MIEKNSPQAVPNSMFREFLHIKLLLLHSFMQVKLTFSNSVYKKYNIDYEYVIKTAAVAHPVRDKKNLTCVHCTLNFIM